LTARARALMTALNLHLAGVAVLVLLDLYLIVHLIFVWQGLSANNADALDQQRVQLIAAQISAKPLRGLDTKLVRRRMMRTCFTRRGCRMRTRRWWRRLAG
jgi:type IV pilus assembly protein PilO